MKEEKPSRTSTTHLLPFEKLSPEAFERLCLWLVQGEWNFDRVEHTGVLGHDKGRDICAWKEGRLWVFQCKRQKAISNAHIKNEVQKALSSEGCESPYLLFFLFSCDISAASRDYARHYCADKGIQCRLLCGSELDEKIKKYPEILKEFFHIIPQENRKGSHVQLIDMPVQTQSEELLSVGKGELLTCAAIEPRLRLPYKTDFIGQDIFFPMIDFRFKNSGDDVAFLTRLEIDVLEIRVNTAPILEFDASATEERDLLIQVKNCGWGPALNVCIDNLQFEKFRKYLRPSPKDYFWQGAIQAEEVVDIVIPRTSIRTPSNNPISCPCGFITYKDAGGKEYGFMFRYDPYPFEDYLIHIEKEGFRVTHQDYARAREPSARYNVLLPTEPSEYKKIFHISHEIAPKDTERFQVVIASEKSADFRLVVLLYYDNSVVVQSNEIRLLIGNPNHLWYYSYLKPSWLSKATELSRGHGNTEAFVRKVLSAGGQEFSEVYLHGDQIVEPREKPQSSDDATDQDRESTAGAFNNIAWILIEQEIDIEEGVRMAERALVLSPDDPYIVDTLALGYYKKGWYQKAVECWEKAQKAGLDDGEIRGETYKEHEGPPRTLTNRHVIGCARRVKPRRIRLRQSSQVNASSPDNNGVEPTRKITRLTPRRWATPKIARK